MFTGIGTRLKDNRYTATLAVLSLAFFSANCYDCVAGYLCVSCRNEHEASRPAVPGNSPIAFERNAGQVDSSYDFAAHYGRSLLALNSQQVRLSAGGSRSTARESLDMVLVGARRVSAVTEEPAAERTNYLIGNDPSRWMTDVPNFRRVRYQEIYPGIDVVYYGDGNTLEHDFVVAPGADPMNIRMNFRGAAPMNASGDGSLAWSVGGASVQWKKPALYQMNDLGRRVPVEGRYRIEKDSSVRFEVGAYDTTRPLTIDPVIAYATLYGHSLSESASRVAVDAAGNSYITGGTNDDAFTITNGGVSSIGPNADVGDAIIVKFAADGKTAIYSTHIGGNDTDIGLGIAVDPSGNIYVTGFTISQDFPTTSAAFQPKVIAGDAGTCFVTKLNAAGNALIYSSYLGGTTLEACAGIAADAAGNAYVTGGTASKNFPTVNAFQPALNSTVASFSTDAFVTKISPDGKTLLYSTFAGGTANDAGIGIAVDAAGNAYVTGGTVSSNFPVTAGAYQTKFAGSGGQTIVQFTTGDAFAMKLDPSGRQIYSTYLGGKMDDVGIGIAVDAQGNAYIGGSTLSPDFPVLKGSQTTFKGAGGELNYIGGDGFLAKLNPLGTALVYATYLGGSLDDRIAGVAVDANGNAFVAGNTLSTDFPVTIDAYQKTYGGGGQDVFRAGDAFMAEVGPGGNLVYSSYLGGSGTDWGSGVAVDSAGAVIVSGGTNSGNFPSTPGSAQTRFAGADPLFTPAGDAFVIKFGPVAAVSISRIGNAGSYASAAVSPGEIVTLGGVGIGPATLQNLQLDSSGRVSNNVANTQVFFDDVPAPLIYASATQTAAIVPYGVSGKTQTMVSVQYNGIRSAAIPIPVVAAVPGLFSADSSGTGQAALLNQDNSYNSSKNAAFRGSIVSIYGTGEGITSPMVTDGTINSTILPKPVQPVTVNVGTAAINSLQYTGAAPGAVAGLFQVNVKIPCDSALGDLPLVVSVGSAKSQGGLTIAIRQAVAAETPACANP
jgi:uncharacterized protein (TIGR03437 family)